MQGTVNWSRMRTYSTLALLGTLALAAVPARCAAAEEDGVAVAILYDTSGSMKDPVRDAKGQRSPKHVIAKRALESIARRLQAFATNTAAGPRPMKVGLYAFSGNGARELVRFGPFDGRDIESWTRNLPPPNAGTPLGNALTTGAQAVLRSGLTRKHVLIITDGLNTVGPEPASVFPGLRRQAQAQQTTLSAHFVAFDVDARVFDGLKKQGATVVGAADETQLNTQLEFILARKILLEDEEPPVQPKTK